MRISATHRLSSPFIGSSKISNEGFSKIVWEIQRRCRIPIEYLPTDFRLVGFRFTLSMTCIILDQDQASTQVARRPSLTKTPAATRRVWVIAIRSLFSYKNYSKKSHNCFMAVGFWGKALSYSRSKDFAAKHSFTDYTAYQMRKNDSHTERLFKSEALG